MENKQLYLLMGNIAIFMSFLPTDIFCRIALLILGAMWISLHIFANERDKR
jgi:hypothetical protein